MLLEKKSIVQEKMMNKTKDYIFLHLSLFMFSFCGVFSKLASSYTFLSLKFFLFYGLSILILFIYTILWQQILKKIPLTTAFFNKSITIIWAMIWGLLFFKEVITIKMIIGSLAVLIGVSLVVSEHE